MCMLFEINIMLFKFDIEFFFILKNSNFFVYFVSLIISVEFLKNKI
jgi:hypothetical protein